MQKEEAIRRVSEDGRELDNLPDEFKQDKEVVFAAVNQFGFALKFASEGFRDDKQIVMTALRESGVFFRHASERLKNDKEVVLKAISNSMPEVRWGSADDFHEVLREITRQMIDDPEVMMALLEKRKVVDDFEILSRSEVLMNDSGFIDRLITAGLVSNRRNLKHRKKIGGFTIVADSKAVIAKEGKSDSIYDSDYDKTFFLKNLHVEDENGSIVSPTIEYIETIKEGYVMSFSTIFWTQGYFIHEGVIYFILPGEPRGFGRENKLYELKDGACGECMSLERFIGSMLVISGNIELSEGINSGAIRFRDGMLLQ